MLDPLREHRETKIDVPANCPIGGNGEGSRRTAAEAIKALSCDFARWRMPVEAFCADSQAGGKTQHDRDTTPQGRRSQARQKGRVMRQRSDRRSPLRGSFMVPVLWPAAAVQRRSPSSAGGAVPRLTCEFALRRTSADEA